jgi:aspartyl-tRNA(Asn)/glutamyl-tRNA(Gln) amidotransferase subunit C
VELSREEVRNIAELAKLDLTEDEVALYAGQLSNILGYFQRLQELDTSHIAPTASVLPLKNVLRPDICGTPLPPELVVANAPEAIDNQFLVNTVLDEE